MEPKDRVQDVLMQCCQKHGSIPIIKKMQGFIIENRFIISKKLGEGAFGQIYSGYDVQTNFNGDKKPIVFKFTKNHSMNDQEFNAMRDIQKCAQQAKMDFVQVYTTGKALILDRQLRNVKHFS